VNRIGWFLREAWRGLWFHRSTTWTAMLSVFGSFLVLGMFLLFTSNVQHALTGLGDRREVVAYLRDNADMESREALIARLDSLYGVAEYVSKERAWEEFAAELGGTELLEAAGQNPLPASIRIKLRPEFLNFASMERISDALAAAPIVEEVKFGGEWVQRLDHFIATLRFVDLAIGLVVALSVVFVVANTIRLAFIARRETLRIMALVGAGNGFIFTPLVLEGVIATGLAAALALGAVQGAAAYFDGRPVDILPLPLAWSGAFVGGAMLLGLVGALVALVPLTRKH
jgi:cell division transport system permease protein